MATPTLRNMSEDIDYCNMAHDLYCRDSRRHEMVGGWVDGNLGALLVDSAAQTRNTTGLLKVLSIGPGNGFIDGKILNQLRQSVKQPGGLHVVILEPDPRLMQEYKELVSRESANFQGIDFEWRSQTLEEYQKISNDAGDKFHFISAISSLYYMEDLGKSLRYLYDKLDDGGLFVIVIMSGEGGYGRLWKFLQTGPTSSNVEEACSSQNIPISETQSILIRCDISACFGPPETLSRDGSVLLDFLTHSTDFARSAPVDYRDDVLRFLGSDACSERGPSGEVIFNGDNVAIVLKRVDHTGKVLLC